MQRNLIYDHCKDAEDGGISIWHFMKGRKRPLFLTSTLESTPNFDSNSAYTVILQKNNYSVLNDKGFNSYKIFFWVGSRCEDYEKNYQDTVLFVNDIQKTIPCAKTRFFIEFQYTESFEFFSLFKRQDLGIERANEISAI